MMMMMIAVTHFDLNDSHDLKTYTQCCAVLIHDDY